MKLIVTYLVSMFAFYLYFTDYKPLITDYRLLTTKCKGVNHSGSLR